MRLKNLYLIVIAMCAIAIASCQKSSSLRPSKTDTTKVNKPGTDVYVTGNVTASNSNFVATVWKNGVAITLGDSSVNSYANSIAVSDTNVYIIGSVDGVTKLWKNGVATTLSGAIQANAVTVSGGNVYVAGGTYINNVYYGTYWKNGSPTVINDAINVIFNAITVVGNDVYVAGNAYLNTGFTAVKYWKNGVATTIVSNDPQGSPVYYNGNVGLGVNGNDVYVTGDVESAAGDQVIATYWKNGTAIPLMSDQTKSSEVNNITVVGNNVYATGYYDYFAMYWVNGVAHKLTDGVNQYTATAITLNGTDLYIAGYSGYADKKVVYWKNGILVPLTQKFSVATGIGVVKH